MAPGSISAGSNHFSEQMREIANRPTPKMAPNEKDFKYLSLDNMIYAPLRKHNLTIFEFDDNSNQTDGNVIIGVTPQELLQQPTETGIDSTSVFPAFLTINRSGEQPIINLTPSFFRLLSKESQEAVYRYLMFRAMFVGIPLVEFRMNINFRDEKPMKVNPYDLSHHLNYPALFIESYWPLIQEVLNH